MKFRRRNKASISMLLGLALALSQMPSASVTAQDQITDAEADALIAQIESDATLAEQELANLRSDRLHPSAVIEVTGPDPDAIVSWVGANTRWVPYMGTLRGPIGTLMDRSGNSLDRALLLARLLSVAGHDGVRLARTELPPEMSRRLAQLEAVRSRSFVDDLGPDELLDEYRDDVDTTASDVLSLLAADLPRASSRDADAATSAMADHWWVQLMSDGEVIDLDPLSSLDAASRPPVIEVFAPEEVPDELRHRVVMRILIERLDADGRHEEVVLEETIPLDGDRPYRIAELAFIPDPGPSESPEDADRIDQMASLPYWRPRLDLDGTTTTGEWFSTSGRLESPGTSLQEGKFEEGASTLGALGRSNDTPEPTASELTAARIEYQAQAPGRATQVERRGLFDVLASEADRAAPGLLESLAERDATDRGLGLLGSTVALIQGAPMNDVALSVANLQDVIDNRSSLIAMTFLAAGREDDRINRSLATGRPAPLDPMAISALRELVNTDRGLTFQDGINILSTHVVFDPADDDATAAALTDIVLNQVGVLPGDGMAAVEARVRQGVLDTMLEHRMKAETAPGNTWARFADRGTLGEEWAVWANPEDMAGPGVQAMPAAEMVRIRRSLDDGNLVVVAPTPGRRGSTEFAEWWRVSPEGNTLGIGYRGWGPAGEDATVRLPAGYATRAAAKRQAAQICARWALPLSAVEELTRLLLLSPEYGGGSVRYHPDGQVVKTVCKL